MKSKIIYSFVRNYLNEMSGNENNKLYRGYFKQNGPAPKNKNAVVYFSPSIEYARDYGDGSVISTEMPNNIFDVFNNKRHFSIMKNWLSDKIEQIASEKEDEDGFLPRNISAYIKDANTYLKKDDPTSLVTAFVNAGIAYFDGDVKTGVFEKLFMDDNSIDAMYQFESGLIKNETDKFSIAFKDMPKYEILN